MEITQEMVEKVGNAFEIRVYHDCVQTLNYSAHNGWFNYDDLELLDLNSVIIWTLDEQRNFESILAEVREVDGEDFALWFIQVATEENLDRKRILERIKAKYKVEQSDLDN